MSNFNILLTATVNTKGFHNAEICIGLETKEQLLNGLFIGSVSSFGVSILVLLKVRTLFGNLLWITGRLLNNLNTLLIYNIT